MSERNGTGFGIEGGQIAGFQTPAAIAVKAALFMGVFAVLWAVIERLGHSLSSGYSPYQVVWTRYLVHILLVIGVMLLLKRPFSFRTGRWRTQLVRSAMMLIMPVAFVLAAGRASSGSVWSVVWLAPILTMAGDRLLRGTAVTASDWAVATICFAGVVLSLHPDPGMSLRAASWSLLCATSFAAYLVMTSALREDGVWISLFYTALVPFIALTAVMPAVWTPVSLHAGFTLAAIGAIGLLALFALDKSIRMMEPSHVAVFMFLQVVVGALIVRELDDARSLIGTVIVAGGLTCGAIMATRRRRSCPVSTGGDFSLEIKRREP